MKWCSAHYYTFYVSVVPAKYESHLYGSADSKKVPLRQYVDIMEDYFAEAPEGANTVKTNPRVHGLNREPFAYHYAPDGRYQPQCNAGECPIELLADRIYPGDEAWLSHPEEESKVLFKYNTSYTEADWRVAYHSEKYPWLRMASKWVQPANLHSDFDLLAVAINNTLPDDGQHYLIHWLTDTGGDLFYSDVADVYVHPEPVGEDLRYGVGGEDYSFSRMDHCQYTGFKRTVTPIRDATESPLECTRDLEGISSVKGANDGGDLPGSFGINIVPLTKPKPVAFTVMRAIEDVNPLCVAECTADFGEGSGRCRQHDNTNGLDWCWAHSVHNVTGEEFCTKGKGVLVLEAIPEFLCPDAALEGILGVAVDTTLPNIPYTESDFATSAEPTSTSNTTTNWLRLDGEVHDSPVDWGLWDARQMNGKRCAERANHGWSAAKLGPMTLREAVALCAANYPANCGGVAWHHGADVDPAESPLPELVVDLHFEKPWDMSRNSVLEVATPVSTPTVAPGDTCATRIVRVRRENPDAPNADRLNFAEIEFFDEDGAQITVAGATCKLSSGSACTQNAPLGASIDGDYSSYFLSWNRDDWIEAVYDLGDSYVLGSISLRSRAHGSGYIYPGSLTVTSVKEEGGRCALWTVAGSSTTYTMTPSDAATALPPTLQPTPSPVVSAAPTATSYPLFDATEFAPNTKGPESNASAFFDGSGDHLEFESPFDGAADFVVSFWFKAAEDPNEAYKNDAWGNTFSEGVGLVELDHPLSSSKRSWGVALLSSGVSFGIAELSLEVGTQRDAVLRSHNGEGKEFTWQILGAGSSPATDKAWHYVEAKRVGSHATLSLDGHIVMINDNCPDWGSSQNTGNIVRIGRGFHGWIDEVKLYKLNNARGHYDSRPRDRDGDGSVDNSETTTTKAWLSGISAPSSVDLFSGKHSFVPCLYEEAKERTVWLGTNPATENFKEVDCPYCISCKTLKVPKGISNQIDVGLSEMTYDLNFTNRGKADNTIIVSRKWGWRFDNTVDKDRAGFHLRKMSWCDTCKGEDHQELKERWWQGACRECYTLACRLSDEAPVNDYEGLISDPGELFLPSHAIQQLRVQLVLCLKC